MRSPVPLFFGALPPISRRTVLRYAGAARMEENAVPQNLLEECERALTPRLCYRAFPLTIDGHTVRWDKYATESEKLARHLAGCSEVVLLAGTAGVGIDRLLAKYGALSPTSALFVQAIGAERVEALCDAFCQKLGEKALCTSRFSPGYGDLGLEVQSMILDSLDAQNTIGLFLTDSLMLTPTKSVTAFVGIQQKKEEL